MGHADIQTTMKYLHYAPRAQDAWLVAEAFQLATRLGSISLRTYEIHGNGIEARDVRRVPSTSDCPPGVCLDSCACWAGSATCESGKCDGGLVGKLAYARC